MTLASSWTLCVPVPLPADKDNGGTAYVRRVVGAVNARSSCCPLSEGEERKGDHMAPPQQAECSGASLLFLAACLLRFNTLAIVK